MMKKRRRNAARIKAEQRQITFNRRPGQGGKGGRGMEKVIGEGILAKRMLLQKQQGWDHYRNMAVYAIHAYNVCDGVLLTSKQFKTRSNALKFFDYCAKQKEG